MRDHDPALLTRVFADLAHVMFCLKDEFGHYQAANDAFVRRTGKRSLRQVVGRTAHDLFPKVLASSYEAQDRAVFATGQPVRFQLETISDADGHEAWYLTNKLLVESEVSGSSMLAVISVEAQLPRGTSPTDVRMRAAIDHARTHFRTAVRIDELARIAGMSLAQFERGVGRALGVQPKQFVQRLRSDYAASLLVNTDRSIAEIASMSGYYDQSQFTRMFRAATGLAPGAYRASIAER